MDNYTGNGEAAVGTDKTVLTLISAATVRPHLYEFAISCDATPADYMTNFVIMRFTAVGTEGSGFTPVLLDPSSPAALCDCGVGTFSVEPTYTASSVLWNMSLHQRGSFRWMAYPGKELIAPATASNGLGLKATGSGSTQVHQAVFYWHE